MVEDVPPVIIVVYLLHESGYDPTLRSFSQKLLFYFLEGEFRLSLLLHLILVHEVPSHWLFVLEDDRIRNQDPSYYQQENYQKSYCVQKWGTFWLGRGTCTKPGDPPRFP